MTPGPAAPSPPSYKALIRGVDTFFNPIEAIIDTTGGIANSFDPNVPVLGPQTSAYEGPLTTFVSLEGGQAFDGQKPLKANASLRFHPMPDRLQARTDSSAHHLVLTHDAPSTDDRSGALRVGVVVYDATGNPIRRLDGGTVTVTPGTTKTGSVTGTVGTRRC